VNVSDDLALTLDWIQARLGRELTIDTGTIVLEGVLVHGREPGFKLREGDAYDLDVYVKIDSIRLDVERLSVKVDEDEGVLVLDTPGGRVRIEEA
jgi:hypothetical protein